MGGTPGTPQLAILTENMMINQFMEWPTPYVQTTSFLEPIFMTPVIDTCDCLFWGNLFSDKPTLTTMKGRERSLVCLVASPKSPDMFSVDRCTVEDS